MILDDEPGAVSNLETLLRVHPDVLVTATINNPERAVESILEKEPDLLFLDIQMPGMSGFDVAKALTEAEIKANFARSISVRSNRCCLKIASSGSVVR
jgi:DNA-binding NarL/FixJ family response regulator